MKTSLFAIMVVIISLFTSWNSDCLMAQGSAEWAAVYNGSGNREDSPKAMAVDEAGNVYITGSSWGGESGLDWITIKYNTAGDTLWTQRYNGPGNGSDSPDAIVVDDSGNVFVTGGSTGDFTYGDVTTIKYNATGAEKWKRFWNSPWNASESATGIVLGDSGNIFVSGSTYRGGHAWDYLVIKYNSKGDERWYRVYAGTGIYHDNINSMGIDNSGNIYVTGRSFRSGTDFDFATLKYSSAGDSLWLQTYNGPANNVDEAFAMAVDDSGNAYVTGRSLGTESGYDYVTIKYNSAGDTLWSRRYNGTANDIDEAYAIAVDGLGNVHVTGVSNRTGTSLDYLTIKYNSQGTEQWVRNYNGPGFAHDKAYSIALDDSGNVYITGESPGTTDTYTDYATIKYNPDGDEKWVKRFNGAINSLDLGKFIGLDGIGNVYVTGLSVGSGSDYDIVTLKYSQKTITAVKNIISSPDRHYLEQNYPNPFNPSTTINYWLPENSKVTLKVFDIAGREVKTLLNQQQAEGGYSLTFNGSDLASGIYFYTIQTGGFIQTRKMIVLK